MRSAYLCRFENHKKFIQHEQMIESCKADFIDKFYPESKNIYFYEDRQKSKQLFREQCFHLSKMGLTDSMGFNIYAPRYIYFPSRLNLKKANFQIGKFRLHDTNFNQKLINLLNCRPDELFRGEQDLFTNNQSTYRQYDWLYTFYCWFDNRSIIQNHIKRNSLNGEGEYDTFLEDIEIICETMNYILGRPDSNKIWIEWRN